MKQVLKKAVEVGSFNFRFECQTGCTNCCTQPGEVYLSEDDVTRAAEYLAAGEQEFREAYCDLDSGGDLRLTTPPDKACHFLLEGACSIHEAKPLQCRAFPFWPEHVGHKRAWKRLSGHCPGIGVGAIVPLDEVRAMAQACEDALPSG